MKDMPRPESQAALSVERFFQLSLLGLVSSGYLAVAGSGYLDVPTIALTTAGVFARALWICGILRFTISDRTTTVITVAYSAFFLVDYLALSHEFLPATVHLLFFLAVMKILTARSNRDYLYTAVIAFLELLAAAILSVNFNFFLFLALYLVFAIATLSSAEIRRSMHRATATARVGSRRFAPRLTMLAMLVTVGILVLTGGLFFILPRTAEAAFARLSPRSFLPGFATQVTLGEIGEIKTSSRPVMHVSIYSSQRLGGLKWRGGVLTEFDGKRWSNPTLKPARIEVQNDHVELVPGERRPFGRRISYHVDLEAIQNDELFFAGTPEFLDLRSRVLYRTDAGTYSLGKPLSDGYRYDASSLLEDAPELTPLLSPPPVLRLPERERDLQLPKVDPRIAELARTISAGAPGDLERARTIERHLRKDYSYTLELPGHEVADPLAYFLFTRRKGHCEYFASAMAVMLRTLGIPARLATGFQSGIYNDVTELWLIRAGDAHSWVEAWIPGHGWTTFDPTPPDPNQHTFALFTRLSLYLDATETFWRDWVVTYDIARQGTLAYRMEQNARRMGIRWFDAVLAARSGWNRYVIGGGKRFGIPAAWTAAGLFLVWLLGRPLLRLLRMRQRVQRVRRGQASVADATLLYQRMLEVLGKRGYHKPAWFTPAEFAASLPGGPLAMAVAEFTTTYNAVRFGGHIDTAPHLTVLLDRMEAE
jgi:transglutaminase-like putative cysteine protease